MRPDLRALLHSETAIPGLPRNYDQARFLDDETVAPPVGRISLFASYAHADREFEQRLLGDLQAAGIKVWVDHERLKSGTPDWEIAIRRGITASNPVIYIGSEDAMASVIVRSELTIAHDNSIPIHAIWSRGTTWSRCAPFRLAPCAV
ncbi:MAG TPA: toll/interleukin-1 receptor domain-containing protein [Ktedonobacterales bacterium]|nr:toll/interleukin-1 receptor domain-containing protein [Ktedonobacterales bacterium]